MSTRSHLLILVAALLVPLLLVIGTVAYFYISTERNSREMTAMAGARELATSIDGIVSVPIASLRVLAPDRKSVV